MLVEEEDEEARIGAKDLWKLKWRVVRGVVERREKDFEEDDDGDATEERATEGGVCKVIGISGFLEINTLA